MGVWWTSKAAGDLKPPPIPGFPIHSDSFYSLDIRLDVNYATFLTCWHSDLQLTGALDLYTVLHPLKLVILFKLAVRTILTEVYTSTRSRLPASIIMRCFLSNIRQYQASCGVPGTRYRYVLVHSSLCLSSFDCPLSVTVSFSPQTTPVLSIRT